MKKSLYAILEVDPLATQESIETVYRASIQKLEERATNGDMDAHNEAVLIRDAFRTLSIPAKRAEYDARLLAEKNAPQQENTAVVLHADEDSGSALLEWWRASRVAILLVSVGLIAVGLVGVGYYKKANAKPVEVQVVEQSAQVEDTAKLQASNKLEQESKQLQLRQQEDASRLEKEKKQLDLLQKREEERQAIEKKQKEENEQWRAEEAKKQRDQESSLRAERERKYRACVHQYGQARAPIMCAGYR